MAFLASRVPTNGAKLPFGRRVAVSVAAVASSDVKMISLQAQRVSAEAFAPYGQVRAVGAPRCTPASTCCACRGAPPAAAAAHVALRLRPPAALQPRWELPNSCFESAAG